MDSVIESGGGGRRDFLKKAGLGAAAAWTAPVVLAGGTAWAQGSQFGAPIFRSSSTNVANGGATSVAIAAPAGTATGDLLLAIIAVHESDTIASTPAGWTLWSGLSYVATGTRSVRAFLYYRAVSGTVGSTTWTRTTATGRGPMRGAIVAYRPPAGASSVALDGGTTPVINSINSAEVTTHNFGSVVTTGPNRRVVRLGAQGQADGIGQGLADMVWQTPNPGTDANLQSYNTGGTLLYGSRAIHVSSSTQATAGTVTGGNGTSNFARKSVQFTVAIRAVL